MRAVKAVQQRYALCPEILWMLEQFRQMLNDCVRIGLAENPNGTSVKCSICGSRMARIPEENRTLKCRSCGFTVDRDVNAARNILARGVRFAPVALPVEAMVQGPLIGNPES